MRDQHLHERHDSQGRRRHDPGALTLSGESSLRSEGERGEGGLHGLPVPCVAVLDAGHLRTHRLDLLGAQVKGVLGDSRAAVDRLEFVAPLREDEVADFGVEGENLAAFGLGDATLGLPLELTMDVLADPLGSDDRAVESVLPGTCRVRRRPLTHAGDVGDQVVDRTGIGGDVSGHGNGPFAHGRDRSRPALQGVRRASP